MKERTRRRFSAEQKSGILKRHLMGKEQVSVICEDVDISPNQFYRWQLELFQNAAAAFAVKQQGSRPKSRESELSQTIDALEDRLRLKDNVIAEIAEELVVLKKKHCPR